MAVAVPDTYTEVIWLLKNEVEGEWKGKGRRVAPVVVRKIRMGIYFDWMRFWIMDC